MAAADDPNDLRNSENSPEGLALTPLSLADGKRNGPREYVVKTAHERPDRLQIRLNTLVTKIIFDCKRAVAVEAREGDHLYEASAKFSKDNEGKTLEFRVSREVIISAGAFNSPQLLKLSGIGPKEELDKLEIPVLVDLQGVGENLQDRYEVSVVSNLPEPFALLKDRDPFIFRMGQLLV